MPNVSKALESKLSAKREKKRKLPWEVPIWRFLQALSQAEMDYGFQKGRLSQIAPSGSRLLWLKS